MLRGTEGSGYSAEKERAAGQALEIIAKNVLEIMGSLLQFAVIG